MRPTLSSLVRRVLLEADDTESKGEHPLHARAYEIAQRFENSDTMASAVSPDTMIGRGGNAAVYAIPGEEELVLRVLKSGREEGSVVSASRVSNPFGDMNVGQPLARVGSATVLLKQSGEPAGMTNTDPAYKTPDRDHVYARRIHNAASLSQDAYEQVCRDLMQANELGHQWDPSKSNNILIDVSRDRFGLVDLSPKSKGSNYANSAGELIVALVGNTHAYKAAATLTAEEEQAVMQDRAKIVQLTVDAASKVGCLCPITFVIDLRMTAASRIALSCPAKIDFPHRHVNFCHPLHSSRKTSQLSSREKLKSFLHRASGEREKQFDSG